MKIWMTILLTILLLGCGKKTDETNMEQTSQVEEQQSQLKEASAKLVGKFMGDLKSELMSAMNEGGAVNAISVCSEKAPAIAADYSTNGWTIMRVSDKNRNPDNLATDHEKEILALFADTAAKKTYYDEWEKTDSSGTYYYYKPIFTGKFCLTCHGDAEKIDPKVKKEIADKYPDDKAVGYKEGDLRGMFVVEVETPRGFNNINMIMNDSL